MKSYRELLEHALDLAEDARRYGDSNLARKAIDTITAINEALAQPVQEPPRGLTDEWILKSYKNTLSVCGPSDLITILRGFSFRVLQELGDFAGMHAAMSEHYERQKQAKAAQPEQEPVAWQVHPFDYGVGSEGVFARTERLDQVEAWKRKGWNVQPLCACHPQHQPLTDEQKPAVVLMSETVEKAAQESGFIRVKSCCDVPRKFCSTDEWRGELRSFSMALLRLVGAPQRQPLTDQQIDLIPVSSRFAEAFTLSGVPLADDLRDFARAVENMHGIVGQP